MLFCSSVVLTLFALRCQFPLNDVILTVEILNVIITNYIFYIHAHGVPSSVSRLVPHGQQTFGIENIAIYSDVMPARDNGYPCLATDLCHISYNELPYL